MRRGWDAGIPYDSLLTKLLKAKKSAKSDIEKCYISILLIQLRNGSRISEAVRAYKQFLQDGKFDQFVRLSKQKTENYRKMKIPQDVTVCGELLDVDEKKLITRVRSFAKKRLNINTHSLRYAFITKLLEKGVESAIIAKITGHKNLNHIITYTQSKVAERILDEEEW